MANSFQDRIRNAMKKVTTNPSGAGKFDEVLKQFAETVAENPYVGTAIEKGHQPSMRSFVTWPRYRRDERSIMLTFWWDGTTMKVLNEKERAPFTTPEALSEYLLDFLENSAFPSTLAEYETRCKEPVDGFLRTQSLIDAGPDDVMVEVAAADQKRLAEATPGEKLELIVKVEAVPGTARYQKKGPYRFLSSAGFGLRGVEHDEAAGKVTITGEVMRAGETQ